MLDHHFVRRGGKRDWFFRALEQRIDRMPRAILDFSRGTRADVLARQLARIRRAS